MSEEKDRNSQLLERVVVGLGRALGVPAAVQRLQNRARRQWAQSTRRATGYYAPNHPRECERRRRQNAYQNQLNSHKPGTLHPRHIFPSAGGGPL